MVDTYPPERYVKEMNQLPLFQPASLSVTELTHYVRDLLASDDMLSDVWVQGEISNASKPSSGHIYFTLKDSGAALRCVMWKSIALRQRFGIQNGLAVEAHGAIGVYERDGAYQLYVDAVRPAGEGLLYQEFLRLKTRLEAEGLFDPGRKRTIPARPQRIGIVTSPTGAALQDMLNTLRARYPLVEVVISPCSVQGDPAPMEIVTALDCLCRRDHPDLVIIARGGGSLEDLWAFNDERVVRAIAAAPVPVITGIGHETDFTLADFVSDLRAPTPTGAAVLATPDQADLRADLDTQSARLSGAMLLTVSRRWQDLDMIRQRLDRASPRRRIQDERSLVETQAARSQRALEHTLLLRRAHLNGLHNRLLALNPAAVLQRGYAMIEHPDGSLLRSVGEAQLGERLGIRMTDGRLAARVENVSLTAPEPPIQHQETDG